MPCRISIRAPLAGSDFWTAAISRFEWISIRAPLAGSDQTTHLVASHRVISIRAPLAGSDPQARASPDGRCPNFNPRSPCGERPRRSRRTRRRYRISIRAPLAGSDAWGAWCWTTWARFQSALPLRGATDGERIRDGIQKFQSALPLRGATSPRWGCTAISGNFNPRSPCGERRWLQRRRDSGSFEFQSALPLRGATMNHYSPSWDVF